MKTVKHVSTGQIARVSNVEAFKKVNSGLWAYCPKQEWKQGGRK